MSWRITSRDIAKAAFFMCVPTQLVFDGENLSMTNAGTVTKKAQNSLPRYGKS
jgi:hypothetical protein